TGVAEDFEPPLDPLHSRAGVWLDPARRTPGVSDRSGRTRRVFRLEDISPARSEERRVGEEGGGQRAEARREEGVQFRAQPEPVCTAGVRVVLFQQRTAYDVET